MVQIIGGASVVSVGILELAERVQCRDLFEGKLWDDQYESRCEMRITHIVIVL
jgi:hypothetical protein